MVKVYPHLVPTLRKMVIIPKVGEKFVIDTTKKNAHLAVVVNTSIIVSIAVKLVTQQQFAVRRRGMKKKGTVAVQIQHHLHLPHQFNHLISFSHRFNCNIS